MNTKNKVRLGKKVSIHNYSLTPVERLSLESYQIGTAVYCSAAYEPLGVIVEYNGEEWAIDVSGLQVDIADLISSAEE